jgi:hypothetical protein
LDQGKRNFPDEQMPAKPKLRQGHQALSQNDALTIERYLARESEMECRIVDAAAALFRKHGFANVRRT